MTCIFYRPALLPITHLISGMIDAFFLVLVIMVDEFIT
jgi:hypothetical protein